jgi:hypothetical protein
MWSSSSRRRLGDGRRRPDSLHISTSHPTQPADEIPAVILEASAAWWRKGIREHLGDRLALEVDVGPGVAHRRVQAGMAEPLADRGEVHARLQQRNGRAVTQRVWMLLSRKLGVRRVAASTYRRSR